MSKPGLFIEAEAAMTESEINWDVEGDWSPFPESEMDTTWARLPGHWQTRFWRKRRTEQHSEQFCTEFPQRRRPRVWQRFRIRVSFRRPKAHTPKRNVADTPRHFRGRLATDGPLH
jgi:hypothetical protein